VREGLSRVVPRTPEADVVMARSRLDRVVRPDPRPDVYGFLFFGILPFGIGIPLFVTLTQYSTTHQ